MSTKSKSLKSTKKVVSKTTTVSRAWSKKDDSALIKALNAGHSAVETAAILGRTVPAVWNRKFNLKSTFKSAASKSFRNNALPMPVKKSKTSTVKSAKAVTVSSSTVAKKVSTAKPVAKKSTTKAPVAKVVKKSTITAKKSSSKKK